MGNYICNYMYIGTSLHSCVLHLSPLPTAHPKTATIAPGWCYAESIERFNCHKVARCFTSAGVEKCKEARSIGMYWVSLYPWLKTHSRCFFAACHVASTTKTPFRALWVVLRAQMPSRASKRAQKWADWWQERQMRTGSFKAFTDRSIKGLIVQSIILRLQLLNVLRIDNWYISDIDWLDSCSGCCACLCKQCRGLKKWNVWWVQDAL